MGFIRGFVAPFRGVLYVTRAGLWHLVLVPLLMNIALAIGAGWAAFRYWQSELSERVGGSPALHSLFLGLTTMLGAIVLFVVLQPLFGAVFNDILSERVERKILGEAPKAPFLASLGRSLAHGILKLVLYACALVVGLLVSVATAGLGSIVGIGLGALFLAYDGFDYPLGRRSAGFGAKWRYLALHPAQTVGYGLGATAFYLMPLAFVVVPPFAAVGATLVFLDTEKRKNERQKAEAQKRDNKRDDKRDNTTDKAQAPEPATERKGKERVDEASAYRN